MWVQRQQQSKASVPAHEQAANTKLSLYEDPPETRVSLEEFETFAIDRLKVLKSLENDKARGFKFPQMQERAKQYVGQHLSGGKTQDAQRKDCISHFVLRLAYCRTNELRRWFVTQESDLFRYRFSLEPTSNQAAFMRRYSMPFEVVEPAELEEVKGNLMQVLYSLNLKDIAADLARGASADLFYKVPWEQVPDLVGAKRVFLRRGTAYVHKREMGSLVVSHFKAHLSRALALTARKWAAQVASEEESRLGPVVDSLSLRYLGPDFGSDENTATEALSYSQLAGVARQSFPLCMLNMYNHVREEHHLRHNGRMQLGLFLKGIGLPLEEALKFWRSEFSRKVPPDVFDKQYAYNIRHNYGKEGKRVEYTPHSCVKIISSVPGQGDHHGCPYKTWSAQQLTAQLSQMRLSGSQVSETVAKAKAGHYQLACALAFEGVHKCSCDSGINHPNQYFMESRKALAAKSEKEGGPAPMQVDSSEVVNA